MKTISGPKLQTFYTCYTNTEKCMYFSGGEMTKGISCKKGIDVRFMGGIVKTPVNCPLLGKTTEEGDMNFNKDVLMRNL